MEKENVYMRVLIAEKPSQAQAYASALGNRKRHDDYIEVGDLAEHLAKSISLV
jgi:hypothetical protein